jgi:hypothetical protein
LPHEPDQEPAGHLQWDAPHRYEMNSSPQHRPPGFPSSSTDALAPAKHYRLEPSVRAVMIKINRRLHNRRSGYRARQNSQAASDMRRRRVAIRDSFANAQLN